MRNPSFWTINDAQLNRVQLELKARRMRIVDLARAVGVTRQNMHRLVYGTHPPSRLLAEDVAEALGIEDPADVMWPDRTRGKVRQEERGSG